MDERKGREKRWGRTYRHNPARQSRQPVNAYCTQPERRVHAPRANDNFAPKVVKVLYIPKVQGFFGEYVGAGGSEEGDVRGGTATDRIRTLLRPLRRLRIRLRVPSILSVRYTSIPKYKAQPPKNGTAR